MRKVFLAILGLVVFSGWSAAAEKARPSYGMLRAELIRQGYRPLKMQHGPNYFCSEGFCDAYPETITCTAAGLHYCSMAFARPSSDSFLVVDTLGEVIHRLLVVRQRGPHSDELCAIKQLRDPCENYGQAPPVRLK